MEGLNVIVSATPYNESRAVIRISEWRELMACLNLTIFQNRQLWSFFRRRIQNPKAGLSGTMATSAVGSRHAKTIEKIFLSLRTSCDKKLEELGEKYSDQEDWLRTSLLDTFVKEKK